MLRTVVGGYVTGSAQEFGWCRAFSSAPRCTGGTAAQFGVAEYERAQSGSARQRDRARRGIGWWCTIRLTARSQGECGEFYGQRGGGRCGAAGRRWRSRETLGRGAVTGSVGREEVPSGARDSPRGPVQRGGMRGNPGEMDGRLRRGDEYRSWRERDGASADGYPWCQALRSDRVAGLEGVVRDSAEGEDYGSGDGRNGVEWLVARRPRAGHAADDPAISERRV